MSQTACALVALTDHAGRRYRTRLGRWDATESEIKEHFLASYSIPARESGSTVQHPDSLYFRHPEGWVWVAQSSWEGGLRLVTIYWPRPETPPADVRSRGGRVRVRPWEPPCWSWRQELGRVLSHPRALRLLRRWQRKLARIVPGLPEGPGREDALREQRAVGQALVRVRGRQGRR